VLSTEAVNIADSFKHTFKLLTGNSFVLLAILSSYWKFFRLTGNSFVLLEILSSYWKFFRPTGNSFVLLEILSSYWKFFRPTGNSFVLLEFFLLTGNSFVLLEILSSYWKFFRLTGNSFVLLEFFRLTGNSFVLQDMCFFKDIKTTVWRTSSKQEWNIAGRDLQCHRREDHLSTPLGDTVLCCALRTSFVSLCALSLVSSILCHISTPFVST
jgi:hypothetical protein